MTGLRRASQLRKWKGHPGRYRREALGGARPRPRNFTSMGEEGAGAAGAVSGFCNTSGDATDSCGVGRGGRGGVGLGLRGRPNLSPPLGRRSDNFLVRLWYISKPVPGAPYTGRNQEIQCPG